MDNTIKRIAIDMDEVIADANERFASWYQRDHGTVFAPEQLSTTRFTDLLPEEHKYLIKEYVYHDDFFKDLTVIKDSKEVIGELYKKYEIFITTAAMEFPNSFLPKLQWMKDHFPYITWKNIVYCGDKSIINADYLIDDNVGHFKRFIGQGILFTAPHNVNVEWDTRVNSWKEVADMLL